MIIKYKNTKEEIYDYIVYLERNSKETKKSNIYITSGLIIFYILMINIFDAKYRITIEYKMLFIFIMSIILFILQFVAKRIGRNKKVEYVFNEGYFDNEVEVDINEDYVIVKSYNFESRIEWVEKPKLVSDKKSYYFILNDENTLVIPKDIFITEEEKRLFKENIEIMRAN